MHPAILMMVSTTIIRDPIRVGNLVITDVCDHSQGAWVYTIYAITDPLWNVIHTQVKTSLDSSPDSFSILCC